MAYSSTMVANNILSRSFTRDAHITPMKLQSMLYFAASEYQKVTGRPLLEELFSVRQDGTALCSVHSKFACYGDNVIIRYARDARGNAFVVDEGQDVALKSVLDWVYHAAGWLTGEELSQIVRGEGSAWRRAYEAGSAVIDSVDVAADCSYREPLGLGC